MKKTTTENDQKTTTENDQKNVVIRTAIKAGASTGDSPWWGGAS